MARRSIKAAVVELLAAATEWLIRIAERRDVMTEDEWRMVDHAKERAGSAREFVARDEFETGARASLDSRLRRLEGQVDGE